MYLKRLPEQGVVLGIITVFCRTESFFFRQKTTIPNCRIVDKISHLCYTDFNLPYSGELPDIPPQNTHIQHSHIAEQEDL